MRIGLWGARADNTGLGNISREFYNNIHPDKVMIADISQANGKTNDLTRYPAGTPLFQLFPDEALMREFLKDLDVVFVPENPYDYDFFRVAREMGVKTVLQFNYEFIDYYEHPDYALPDVMLAPSTWHLEKVHKDFDDKCVVDYIPVPVNREVIAHRKIKKARTFIHVAGYDLYEDRNSTKILIKAIPYIRTKAKIIIYSQHPFDDEDTKLLQKYPNVTVVAKNVTNYWELYETGDVMVMPRRYGGGCLPLSECMAAGMIPMMPNIDPQMQFLHNQTLTPVCKRTLIPAKAPDIYAYDVEPQTLAYHIDRMFVTNHGSIEFLSDYSDNFAKVVSWDALRDFYLALFDNITR